MNHQNPQTKAGKQKQKAQLERTYNNLKTILSDLSLTENPNQWGAVQKALFEVKAALRARDSEFQEIDLPGTRLNVPTSQRIVGDNPTVDTENGELEVPTKEDNIRILDDFGVCDPKNPHQTKAVTIDHEITTDGEIKVEINGTDLADIPHQY